MNREALKTLGLTDEQVNEVMKAYGKSIVELQNGLSAAQTDSENVKAELKKYQKDGELYVDPDEVKRLKQFETDTLSKEANAKKTAALTKLFKGANASDGATKLLIAGSKLDEIELDDKGEIKGGGELLKKAKADYADLFAADGNAGVPQGRTAGVDGGATKKQAVY
jgi:hypothetical protein